MRQVTRDFDEFESQVADLVMRTEALQKNADSSANSGGTLEEALQELRNSIEELQVVQEELRAQNLELELSRSVIETERRRYRELFDFAPDAYLETSADGAIYDANVAAEALVLAPSRFLTGQPLTAFIHEDDLPSFRGFLANLRNAPDRQEYGFRLVSRDKVVVPVSASVVPAHNSTGQSVSLLWLLRRRDNSNGR